MDLSITLPTSVAQSPEQPSATRRPFLTPLPTPGHFLLVLDNTSLEKIKRCHVAARNYLILGVEPPAKNAALTFGGAVHEGLEAYLKGEPSDEVQRRIVQYFQDNPAGPDEYRTAATACEVLRHYQVRSTFPDYEWEVCRDEKGVPIIEQAFELPLGVLEVDALVPINDPAMADRQVHNPVTYVHTIHVIWSGRIDLIANVHSRVRVVDHKTTSIDGDQFIQGFQLSSQTLGYVWAARQLWPHLPVSGFCLNAIRLKKPTGNVGLTEKGPRGGEPALAFFRAFFDYTDERIAEWSEDTLCFIEDFIHSLVRGRFPSNDRHCFDKFGRCPYHDVCTENDPPLRERMLQSAMFKPVTWNPTNGR